MFFFFRVRTSFFKVIEFQNWFYIFCRCRQCPSCPVVRPVFLCGSDNRTYSSLCRLHYHNCIHEANVHVACKGFCPCKGKLSLPTGRESDPRFLWCGKLEVKGKRAILLVTWILIFHLQFICFPLYRFFFFYIYHYKKKKKNIPTVRKTLLLGKKEKKGNHGHTGFKILKAPIFPGDWPVAPCRQLTSASRGHSAIYRPYLAPLSRFEFPRKGQDWIGCGWVNLAEWEYKRK